MNLDEQNHVLHQHGWLLQLETNDCGSHRSLWEEWLDLDRQSVMSSVLLVYFQNWPSSFGHHEQSIRHQRILDRQDKRQDDYQSRCHELCIWSPIFGSCLSHSMTFWWSWSPRSRSYDLIRANALSLSTQLTVHDQSRLERVRKGLLHGADGQPIAQQSLMYPSHYQRWKAKWELPLWVYF